jgi:hypothetical protein
MNRRHQNIDEGDVKQVVATAAAIGDTFDKQSSG